MANFVVGVVTLTLGVVILANVFIQSAHDAAPDATTRCLGSSWNGSHCVLNGAATYSAAEYALWGLLGIAAIAGIVYGVLNIFGLT